ncbi:hypothetical protein J5N97_016138 [Dioscorea zingiberensis]|uniref:beta-galactosidase n=1 Tax=Dioscorea zingiberensis TaxID=325984 RepID=A0A9D5CIU4_9LILI|nr:hypothetical protein J5N97_016138 [Dioscorea zingiberensis]
MTWYPWRERCTPSDAAYENHSSGNPWMRGRTSGPVLPCSATCIPYAIVSFSLEVRREKCCHGSSRLASFHASSSFAGSATSCNKCGVTYDRKAIVINGHKRILISGSIHYARSTPEMWEGLVQKAKDGGLDVIQTYVFWNGHEPSPGNYNFEGRYDLVRFVKTVQKAGLYVHLRIGPYACAEWNFGGFPVWLKYVPGISFRTDNEPFKIENEYGPESKALGPAGYAYMTWAAKMAVGLGTGVPWVMCKEDDAPDPVINTCNGFYCDAFTPNKPYKPTMWTEAWSGWFTEFGGSVHQRPVEDLAFAVARFIQKGGSFINYYMYHGGTNFGRTAGGPFITTSYDYDAPIDEYGNDFTNLMYILGFQFLDLDMFVGVQTSQMQMSAADTQSLTWEKYDEEVGSLEDNSLITATGLLEQINVTRDNSDYLWYITRYHVPRSWLQPTRNLLVVFEELGGDATKISLVKRTVSSVCADVSEFHPMVKNWHIDSYGQPEEYHKPKVHLRCAPGQSISAIKFASFGTPLGTCGSFEQGKCIGKERCAVTISTNNFGGDPCPNVMKRVAVEAVCSPAGQTNA